MASASPRPTDIVLHQQSRVLEVAFDDGARFELPCEFLRVYSPSAEVRGHGKGQETLQVGKRDVNITDIEPVGAYAVKLVFSDGHDTGLYSWETLHELGRDRDALWQQYLDRLAAAGASRDPAAGLDVRAYVSMCFGDPWEGAVPVEQVVGVGKRLFDLGASQLSLGDTIGVGTANQVTALVEAFTAAGMTTDQLAMHFHDTYGQALANAYAGLQAGITTYDASAGGLGGCPYAKSATGNLATEDLVWLLTGLGIEHGVDLAQLVATSVWMAGHLGRPSPSAVVRALGGSAGPAQSPA